MRDAEGGGPQLGILLVCYGNYPQYSTRAIRSLADTPAIQGRCPIHVGCNACCDATIAAMRQHRDQGLIHTLVESARNLNKDPMLRHLLEFADTPYVLIMDDDSHVRDGWLDGLLAFLRTNHPFEVAGRLYYWDRTPNYQRVVERRPWWRGMDHVPPRQRPRIVFATGGFVVARRQFLLEQGWPDRNMVMAYEDVLLSDMAHHHGGKVLPLPDSVLARVVVNDGVRRWRDEEGRNDQADQAARPQAQAHDESGIEQCPLNVGEAIGRGVAHFRAGRFAEAEGLCVQLLQREPEQADALHLLGMVRHQAGHHGEAAQLMQRAIAARPDVPDFHNNLGNVLVTLDRHDEAMAAFQRAVGLRADYAEARNNLANVLARQQRLEEAVLEYEKAIALKPRYAQAYGNLANAWRLLGRSDKVIECCRRVLKASPGSAEAFNELALVCQSVGHIQEALAVMDQAIAMRPSDAHLQFNKALMLLLAGDLARGWPQYEWRLKLPENHDQGRFSQPLWKGEDLGEKTLLLHCEQGLGATMQFVRYAPMVQAKRLVLECQPPLKPLLSHALPKYIEVLARGESLPGFDVQLPLLSLPQVFHTTVETIPAPIPYLHALPTLAEHWRQELARYPQFKVGIAWQGNPAYRADPQRSVPLKHFASIAKLDGIHLFSLQKHAGVDQLPPLAKALGIVDLGPRLDVRAGAFMDTAAVIASLDLVITSDTSIAHLAGAMGRPVWVALCHVPDWRWMLERQDSPWYPSVMRLFRQERPGDWEGVFGRWAEALRREVARRRS